MRFREFLTPAYLTSLGLLVAGPLLVTAGWGILGWILLLLGLCLNVLATLVLHHREELRQADDAAARARRSGPGGRSPR